MTMVSSKDIEWPTVSGGPIEYSEYSMTESPYAGGCAWIDGEWMPLDRASVPVRDFGFTRSDSTYTVASVWHGYVLRLDDHLTRFLDGCEYLQFSIGITRDELKSLALECVSRSQLRECYLEILVTRGWPAVPGDRRIENARNRLHVLAMPYQWVFSPEEQINGISVTVPRTVRRSPLNAVNPQVKNFQWGDLTQGLLAAAAAGERSAILLDGEGRVAEGPGFNVCIVENGSLVAPIRNSLPGITLSTVFAIAGKQGIASMQEDIAIERLLRADEVMATTTAGGVTPVIGIDGRAVGDGSPGPVTRLLQKEFWRMVGEKSEFTESVRY